MDALRAHSLRAVSFDFFVDWRTSSIQHTTYLKRLVESFDGITITPDDVETAINECDGEADLQSLRALALRYNFEPQYVMFNDATNWEAKPTRIGLYDVVRRTSRGVTLGELCGDIRELSGGPLRIGSKGLTLATSTLECFLSTTDAPWPGDVDKLITDAAGTVLGVFEFKKSTLTRPKISDETAANWFQKDKLKYKRLMLLKAYVGAPLFMLFYPAHTSETVLKLEEIRGGYDSPLFRDLGTIDLPVLGDEVSMRRVLQEILMATVLART